MRYCFGDYVLNTARRDLRRCGEVVAMEPQVFDLLAFLIRERERVVSRDDVLDAVWSGRVVSESTLASRINAARKAIGDNGEAQTLIRTIQRKGFRFVGDVIEQTGIPPPSPEAPPTVPPPMVTPPSLPDRPSLAVLPLESMSDDTEDAYFADGMTEEIITALARLRSLFVVARNSTLAYKGRAIDVRVVGQELGVGYVLMGSVRRSEYRVRLNAQLLDATSGVHVWTDRFEGVSGDLFGLQDRVAEFLAAVIEPAIERAEIERVRRRPPQNASAYESYLHALIHLDVAAREATEAMLAQAHEAIALDPNFAPAYMLAARAYIMRKVQGYMADEAREAAEVLALVERGLRADRDDAAMLACAGLCFAWFAQDLPKGLNTVDEAIALNPNHAHAFIISGFLRTRSGETRLAIEHFNRAHRLNPRDSRAYAAYAGASLAYQFEGDFETAYVWATRSVQLNPDFIVGWLQIAACCGSLGYTAEARSAAQRVLAINPNFSAERHCASYPTLVKAKTDAYRAALLRAGLPP